MAKSPPEVDFSPFRDLDITKLRSEKFSITIRDGRDHLRGTKRTVKEAFHRFDALVNTVEYKPGWEFSVIARPKTKHVFLQIHFERDDRDTGNPMPFLMERSIPAKALLNMSDFALKEFIRRCIHDLENHEADEWLYFDGERGFEPHCFSFVDPAPERACQHCGCTENNACPMGCYWADENTCSECVGKEVAANG